jgi:hypothetical protein
MTVPESRTDVISTLFVEQALWESLLDDVGEARMEEPGVEGTWSVKEIVAHLTAWDAWTLGEVRATARGEPHVPDEVATGDVDESNRRFVAAASGRSPSEVRAEWRRVFGELVAAIDQLTDDQLAERGRIFWLPEETLAVGIVSEFSEHYRDHADVVRRWLDR